MAVATKEKMLTTRARANEQKSFYVTKGQSGTICLFFVIVVIIVNIVGW